MQPCPDSSVCIHLWSCQRLIGNPTRLLFPSSGYLLLHWRFSNRFSRMFLRWSRPFLLSLISRFRGQRAFSERVKHIGQWFLGERRQIRVHRRQVYRRWSWIASQEFFVLSGDVPKSIFLLTFLSFVWFPFLKFHPLGQWLLFYFLIQLSFVRWRIELFLLSVLWLAFRLSNMHQNFSFLINSSFSCIH